MVQAKCLYSIYMYFNIISVSHRKASKNFAKKAEISSVWVKGLNQFTKFNEIYHSFFFHLLCTILYLLIDSLYKLFFLQKKIIWRLKTCSRQFFSQIIAHVIIKVLRNDVPLYGVLFSSLESSISMKSSLNFYTPTFLLP